MNPIPVDTPTSFWLRDRCIRFITAGVVLALLYVGRDVLIPLVVAIVLSLLVAPLVRALRRLGAGHTPSVLIAVLAVSLSCLAAAVLLGTQILRVAESLPQYKVTVQRKLEAVNAVTEGRLTPLISEASRLREAAARPLRLTGRILQSGWARIQAAGIVLLVLIFVSLEHESLRDRFIRLVGATDIRAATLALNDAGERLSRFFVLQFAVNLAFGTAIGLGLSLLHVPQAMLFGTFAGAMRFVPYVGAGIAALLSTAFAFAVDPGFSLAAGTLAVFILLDMIVGQLVEPLLVAGRHVKALGILELLLSDARALTLPQKLYQRALSADPHEILTDARAFLKRDSLGAYCDRVLIPALHLARLDADTGAISDDQQLRIDRVIVHVVSALSRDNLKLPRWRYRGSALDDARAGHWLREQREQVSGRWQGPLRVPAGSVVICLGLGSSADDLAAELLARLLLSQKIDARHFSPEELDAGLPPGADPDGVCVLYLVSAFPSPERERADSLGRHAHEMFPYAHVVRVLCPGITVHPAHVDESAGRTDRAARSLVQAMQMCTASPRSAGSGGPVSSVRRLALPSGALARLFRRERQSDL
jgi:predicted PurR-regulated permease PerM